jgi:hypothetical protein
MSLSAILPPLQNRQFSTHEIGHFYFALIGHYHFAVTEKYVEKVKFNSYDWTITNL